MNQLSTVFIEVTNCYTKMCKHCFNHKFNRQTDNMTLDRLEFILALLRSKGVKQVKIVGGEPLLHPDFEGVLKVLDLGKIPFVIISDSEKISDFVPQLKSCVNLKQIRISIDGIEKIHDYIRVRGDYQRMISTISMLHKNGIKVVMNHTINKLNYCDIEKIWDIAMELGVEILFGVVKHCDNETNESLLVFDEFETKLLIDEIMKIKEKNMELYIKIWEGLYDDKGFILSQKSELNKKHIGCYAGQTSCIIDAGGEVWPCALLKSNDENCYGNIFTSDFNIIWESMNRKMSKLERNFDNCNECVYNELCTGGCRGNAYYFGDICGKDPNCLFYTNYFGRISEL